MMSNIVWHDVIVRAWGLFDFAKRRYGDLENNRKGWDSSKSFAENDKKLSWGYNPGNSHNPKVDLTAALAACPNAEEVRQSLNRAHEMLHSGSTFVPPVEWKPAYDLQPWTPFPERAS